MAKDLSECAAPEEVPRALRCEAERMQSDAAELAVAWQDQKAGAPWRMIAKELERCAARIERALP